MKCLANGFSMSKIIELLLSALHLQNCQTFIDCGFFGVRLFQAKINNKLPIDRIRLINALNEIFVGSRSEHRTCGRCKQTEIENMLSDKRNVLLLCGSFVRSATTKSRRKKKKKKEKEEK